MAALLVFMLGACASPPPPAVPAPLPVEPVPPPIEPLAVSVRDFRAVPRNTKTVAVSFTVETANSGVLPAELGSTRWELTIDGAVQEAGTITEPSVFEPGTADAVPVELEVPIPDACFGYADCSVKAVVSRLVPNADPLVSSAEASARFPVVREPRFSVRSIKIKKAELINTKFEVVLRVENPNAVPLRLDRLEYTLFGDRRLWTDGLAVETIPVPAGGTVDKKLTLQMNFINMKRDLLDQVIKLQVVDYRFKGIAGIGTDLPEYPAFFVPYDLQGRTSVTE